MSNYNYILEKYILKKHQMPSFYSFCADDTTNSL